MGGSKDFLGRGSSFQPKVGPAMGKFVMVDGGEDIRQSIYIILKLVTPTDKNADFQLGLYLYDIQELREFKQVDLIRTGGNTAKYPGRPLNLFYALYINSKSQMIADAESEQRIIGRSIQILMDHATLNNPANGDSDEEGAAITFLTLSFEDKSKLWSVLSMPYQLAVYFTVSPVLLSSRKTYDFARVLKTEFHVSQKDKEGGLAWSF